MKRRIISIVCTVAMIAAMVLSMSACGSDNNGTNTGSDSSVEYVIRLGHSDTEDNGNDAAQDIRP